MNKIKNVVVINDFDYTQGGASKVAIETANILSDDYKVYFFSADSSDKSTLNDKVIKVCTNQGEALKDKNKLRGMINGIYNIKAKKELKKLLSSLDNKNTIIHVHGWTKCLSSSVFDISWKMGFKVVLTMHDYFTACPNGGYFNYKRNEICTLKPLSFKCIKCNCDSRNFVFKMYRVVRQIVQNKIVKLNDKLTDVISISDFSEKVLRKTLNKNVNIHRVYNPIDLDPNPVKLDYKKNEYFLYAGRVSKEKGVDIFCEAITRSNQKGLVVGDGSELTMLKEKYPNIEFVGWKSSVEVKEYMKKAKALIFTSRWYETAGLTVLEANSMGIPAIVSNKTAASDFITKNNGILFNGYVDDLVEKINQFETLISSNDCSIDIDRFNYDNYKNGLLKIFNR